MKNLIFSFLILSGALVTQAQTLEEAATEQRTVALTPMLQLWSLDSRGNASTDLSQFSTRLFVYTPVVENLRFALRAAQASVDGSYQPETPFRNLSALTDIQVNGTYYVPAAEMVFHLGLSLPAGKTNLSIPENATSVLISNTIFRFQVPNMGQGLKATPGVTWAHQVGDRVISGLGAAYYYIAPYTPIEGRGEYDPGDELLLTAGLDYRFDETTVLTGDVILTIYGTDRLAGKEVFAPGRKFVLTALFRRYFQFDELRIMARFRSRAKNDDLFNRTSNRYIPNNVEFQSFYNKRLMRKLYLGIGVELAVYETTVAALSGGTLGAVGVRPLYRLSKQAGIPLTLRYAYGAFKNDVTVSGIEIGLGVQMTF